jgi:hypothetical protein
VHGPRGRQEGAGDGVGRARADRRGRPTRKCRPPLGQPSRRPATCRAGVDVGGPAPAKGRVGRLWRSTATIQRSPRGLPPSWRLLEAGARAGRGGGGGGKAAGVGRARRSAAAPHAGRGGAGKQGCRAERPAGEFGGGRARRRGVRSPGFSPPRPLSIPGAVPGWPLALRQRFFPPRRAAAGDPLRRDDQSRPPGRRCMASGRRCTAPGRRCMAKARRGYGPILERPNLVGAPRRETPPAQRRRRGGTSGRRRCRGVVGVGASSMSGGRRCRGVVGVGGASVSGGRGHGRKTTSAGVAADEAYPAPHGSAAPAPLGDTLRATARFAPRYAL